MAGPGETELKCEICGAITDLLVHDGKLICKKCYLALPRKRCAAANRKGYRCMRTVVGDGQLCAAHKAAGAEPLTWELCPICERTYRPVGDACPYCGSTELIEGEVDHGKNKRPGSSGE